MNFARKRNRPRPCGFSPYCILRPPFGGSGRNAGLDSSHARKEIGPGRGRFILRPVAPVASRSIFSSWQVQFRHHITQGPEGARHHEGLAGPLGRREQGLAGVFRPQELRRFPRMRQHAVDIGLQFIG